MLHVSFHTYFYVARGTVPLNAGGVIGMGQGLVDAYETGSGSVLLRAKVCVTLTAIYPGWLHKVASSLGLQSFAFAFFIVCRRCLL